MSPSSSYFSLRTSAEKCERCRRFFLLAVYPVVTSGIAVDPAPQTGRLLRLSFPKKFNLERVSYYFDHEMNNIVDEEHHDNLLENVGKWQESWSGHGRPFLRYRKALTSITIADGRRRKQRKYSYADGPAAFYEYCADARPPRDIAKASRDGPAAEVIAKSLRKSRPMSRRRRAERSRRWRPR